MEVSFKILNSGLILKTFTHASKKGPPVEKQQRDPVQTASQAVGSGFFMFVSMTGICEFKP